jgi:hypothetical protein
MTKIQYHLVQQRGLEPLVIQFERTEFERTILRQRAQLGQPNK